MSSPEQSYTEAKRLHLIFNDISINASVFWESLKNQSYILKSSLQSFKKNTYLYTWVVLSEFALRSTIQLNE